MTPQLVTTLKHIGMLVLLGAASTGLIPLYNAVVGGVTAASPHLPLIVQAMFTLILPLAAAFVSKLRDTVAADLLAEQNASLAAKNVSLAAKNVSLENLTKSVIAFPEV